MASDRAEDPRRPRISSRELARRRRPAEIRRLFDRVAPRYEQVNRLLSLGLIEGWRRRSAAALRLAPGAVVADLGAGSGQSARRLLAAGAGRVLAIDVSRAMLASLAADPGLAGAVRPLLAEAGRLPLADACADAALAVFAWRNFPDREAALAEAARVLRPGGALAILEVAPGSDPLGWLTARYLALAGHLCSGLAGQPGDYRYLAASIGSLPSVHRTLAALGRAGFEQAARRRLFPGGVLLYTARRRAPGTKEQHRSNSSCIDGNISFTMTK